jgi:paraquat-inducible protein B
MSKKVNKTAIGLFVLIGVVLVISAILMFGSGSLFKSTYKYVLYFDGSLKGLSVGAPVTFRGVKIGSVKNISLVYNEKTRDIALPVTIEIEQRIKGAPSLGGTDNDRKMIAMGLRARLEIQNLLAGQLMISFDFYTDKAPVFYGLKHDYPELPTVPVSQDFLELINDVPIKDITRNLNDTLKGLNKIVNSSELESGLGELKDALREVKEAGHSVRMLTEYLEQHPEALLKGKTGKGE